MFPTWSDWDISYTRKGQRKKLMKRVFNVVALAALIIGGVKLRRDLEGRNLLEIVKRYVRMVLMTGSGVLQTAASRVE